ncbi:hypothetical protein [Pseudooceanicola sp.]|uniref:hypothetical protein n=1 Tax=Pseudooceanicola sp. TaxID=1914328 RepID=UPI0035C6BDC9
MPLAEVARVSETMLSATQKRIVDRMLSKYDTSGLTRGEAALRVREIDPAGVAPVTEAAKTGESGTAAREKPKLITQGPGWPDTPRVQTLASIVQGVLADTDDIPPEEDFTTKLLQKLEEAGLDPSTPIVDFYA